MPEYGQFQTQRQIHRGPFGSVFTARRAGDPADRHVIKTCEAAPWLGDSDRASTQLEDFLDAAQVQRRTAENAGSQGHWAPIHDVARHSEGAYLATDLYPATMRALTGSGAMLAPGPLHHLIGSICQGLLELKRACGRPHGRLKPGNILLSSLSRPGRAKVALTDPLPSRQLDEQTSEAADLKAVGELIYQLVVGKPWSPHTGLPEQPDEPWQRLGTHAAGWHRLCRDLAEPQTPLTIEQTLDRLGTLRPSRRRTWALGGGIAAAVMLIVGIALAIFTGPAATQPQPDPIDVDRPYLESQLRAWFGPLYLDLRRNAEPFLADRHLRSEVVPPIRTLEAEGLLVHDVRDVPTARGRAVQRTTELIDTVRQALAAENWPARQRHVERADRLLEAAERFESRDWAGPAAYLRPIARRADPLRAASNGNTGEGQTSLYQVITQTLELSRRDDMAEALRIVDEIEAHFHNVAGHIELISDKDPVLARFGEWVEQQTVSGPERHSARDLLALRDALGRAAALGGELSGFIEENWPKVLTEALPAEGLVEADPPTADTFNRWLNRITDYFRLEPHPREAYAESNRERYQRIAELTAQLEAVADDLPPDLPTANQFRQRVQSLQQALDAEDEAVAPIARHRDQLVALYEEHREDLEGIRFELERVLGDDDAIAEAQQWVQDWKSRPMEGVPPAVAELFAAYRDARFEAFEARELIAGWRRRIELENELSGLFDDLQGLDLLPPAPPQADGAYADRPWVGQLLDADRFTGRYEQRLNEKIRQRTAQLRHQQWPQPDELVQSVAQLAEQVREEVADHGLQLLQVAQYASGVEERLDHWYGPYEPPEESLIGGGGTIDSLLLHWREIEAAGDRDLVNALRPVRSRVEQLQAVQQAAGRRMELRAIAMDGERPTEARFLAWRKLGDLGDRPWPDDLDELEAEGDMRRALLNLRDAIPTPARRDAVGRVIDRASTQRWLALVRRLDDSEKLEAALAMRRGLGVNEDADIDHPRTRFNVLLTELRSSVARADGDEQRIRELVVQFRNRTGAIEGLPAAVTPWLDDLAGALDEEQHGVGDLSTAGPASPQVAQPLRWRLDRQADDGTWAEYAWNGHTLRFARVDHPGDAPSYVATTETPVGLVIDLLDAWFGDPGRRDAQQQRLWDQFADLLADEERRDGPATWRFHSDGRAIHRSIRRPQQPNFGDTWFIGRIPAGWQGHSFYNLQGLNPADNPSRPQPDHPFQQFKPPAAVYLAHLVGCRLPTSDDWLRALAMEPPAVQRGRVANLRDAAWRQQDHHMRRTLPAPAIVGPIRPRADGGTFSPAPDAAAQATFPPQDYNDGVIWFRPVDECAGTIFKNLIGNVAELVHDEPERFPLEPQRRALSAGEIVDALSARPQAVAIAGASALSFHRGFPANPQRLDRDGLRSAYSDVGFRLAFTSPGDPLHRRVQRLLEAPFDGKTLLQADAR